MMSTEHGVDGRLQWPQDQDQPNAGWMKQVLRMTVVGLLISMAYVAWVGLALFATFDLA